MKQILSAIGVAVLTVGTQRVMLMGGADLGMATVMATLVSLALAISTATMIFQDIGFSLGLAHIMITSFAVGAACTDLERVAIVALMIAFAANLTTVFYGIWLTGRR
ncbi:MAG: hypothetical protein A3A33_00060 [Candidatus Yanofskybacteria bacterium RIFCSPLOWO2_01_FULL_49_25]|uniref:Uncharacterized protein n=1 Tax=Candidatus Yanofskybacteria bacterium RIFCSPLOWO2_01_FULL_49_25 TaxID=1802701 RepID=A0A1F8GWK7_9BACT|nr:MAG: hypothetical protein A3A33_00060 [Candidatus Yanofskybacteria bacterium RIFCSPLOWO2_01_FULL_49_25]